LQEAIQTDSPVTAVCHPTNSSPYLSTNWAYDLAVVEFNRSAKDDADYSITLNLLELTLGSSHEKFQKIKELLGEL
jgi:hypothetical protein